MKKLILIWVWLALCVFSIAALADFQAGLEAYKKGDYATALKQWRPAALQGDVNAQYSLGVMYAEGKGVAKNENAAVRWYRKAAAQGHATALNNLAMLLATSKNSTIRNPAKALEYALKAVALTQEKEASKLDTLAEAYYVNGQYEKAVEAEKKAIALAPNDPLLQQNLEKYLRGSKRRRV